MKEMITVRDSDIVAAEINTIKEDTRRVMIANAISIGGKLMEAKAMVPFGEWGKWLEEKVDYSQSTANNLMKLYQEYGSNQESLFDNWTKSETFANLSYSQHMALLALPFADRAEFAESHNVAEMSTRELEREVREQLEAARRERDAALEDNADLKGQLDLAADKLGQMESRVKQEQEAAKKARLELESFRKLQSTKVAETEAAQKAADEAAEKVRGLEKALADAQSAEKNAREELRQARENPEISQDVMEKLRKEAEAEAAKNAAEEIQKKLEKAQKAERAAKEQAKAAEEKLNQLEKQAKMADPDIIAYQTLAQQLMKDYNVLDGYRLKVAGNNPDAGEKLKRFQMDMLGQWSGRLKGADNG